LNEKPCGCDYTVKLSHGTTAWSSGFPPHPIVEVRLKLQAGAWVFSAAGPGKDWETGYPPVVDSIYSQLLINANRTIFVSPLLEPAICSFVPGSGAYGDKIVAYGVKMGNSQNGAQLVFPDGISASVQSWSDTKIEFTVPQGCVSGAVKIKYSDGSYSHGMSTFFEET